MTTAERRIVGTALVWATTAAVIATGAVAAGAPLLIGVLLFVTCIAPWALAPLIGSGAPPPTIAEVLRAVDARDDTRR